MTYIEPEPAYAAAPVVIATSTPEFTIEKKEVDNQELASTSIKALVYKKAALYGANGYQMWVTISTCENVDLNPKLQSRIKHAKGPNGREDSWGLVMINLPWHPDITRAQAQDPEFSLSFMAKEFAAGHASRWTCWRNIFGVVPTASTTPEG